jgi:hypothetical protein
MYGPKLPCGITNSTFRNITALRDMNVGSAIALDYFNCIYFFIDRCIFVNCEGSSHSVIFIYPSSYFFPITRTRFENNSGDLYDVSSDISCTIYESVESVEQLFSSSCSTSSSQRSNGKVWCYPDTSMGELLVDCPDDMVFLISFII